MALMLCGVADAATLCREGGVPTSKIYLAMEKLAGLGLVQIQPTRPKMFAAFPTEVVVNRIIEIARERSDRFAADASSLHATFATTQETSNPDGSRSRRKAPLQIATISAWPASVQQVAGVRRSFERRPGTRWSGPQRAAR